MSSYGGVWIAVSVFYINTPWVRAYILSSDTSCLWKKKQCNELSSSKDELIFIWKYSQTLFYCEKKKSQTICFQYFHNQLRTNCTLRSNIRWIIYFGGSVIYIFFGKTGSYLHTVCVRYQTWCPLKIQYRNTLKMYLYTAARSRGNFGLMSL